MVLQYIFLEALTKRIRQLVVNLGTLYTKLGTVLSFHVRWLTRRNGDLNEPYVCQHLLIHVFDQTTRHVTLLESQGRLSREGWIGYPASPFKISEKKK